MSQFDKKQEKQPTSDRLSAEQLRLGSDAVAEIRAKMPELFVERGGVQSIALASADKIEIAKPTAETPKKEKRSKLSQVAHETIKPYRTGYNASLNAIAEMAKLAWEKVIYPVGKFMVVGSATLFMSMPFIGDSMRYLWQKGKDLIEYWPKVPWPIRWAVAAPVMAFGIISTVFPFIPGSILYLGPLALVIATADSRWFKWSKDKLIQGYNWLRGKKEKPEMKPATV